MSASSSGPADAGQEFLSEFLARTRIERQLTWHEMPTLLGVSTTMLRKYMSGESVPRRSPRDRRIPHEKLARIASVLNYPLEYVTACWQASIDGKPPKRVTVCSRGHFIPPDAERGRCPICRATLHAAQAKRDQQQRAARRAATRCRICGTLGTEWRDLCTPCRAENRAQRVPKGRPAPRSGYRGVVHYGLTNLRAPWHARIWHHNTCHDLGYYPTAEEAAQAYDSAALTLKGPSTELNFPVTVTNPVTRRPE
jgi:transcriptional regulator with XRE-family HTH domain